jgi:hypothetical protein
MRKTEITCVQYRYLTIKLGNVDSQLYVNQDVRNAYDRSNVTISISEESMLIGYRTIFIDHFNILVCFFCVGLSANVWFKKKLTVPTVWYLSSFSHLYDKYKLSIFAGYFF